MRVDWSLRARTNIDATYEYIARDKPLAALAWVERIADAAEKAGAHPLLGRVVPEGGDKRIREVVFGNYRVVYRIEPKRLLVITVIERHRRLRIGSAKSHK